MYRNLSRSRHRGFDGTKAQSGKITVQKEAETTIKANYLDGYLSVYFNRNKVAPEFIVDSSSANLIYCRKDLCFQ